MAENILGGGNLYTAKPFNVINPSGMSSDQSVGTIAAVGEGNRQRAMQTSEGNKNRAASRESDMRNEKLQRDRMSQEVQLTQQQMAQQQAIENRRMALEEQRAQEEREERARANRLADLTMQRTLQRDRTLRMNLSDKPRPALPGPGPASGDTDGDGYLSPAEQAARLRANGAEKRELETRMKKMYVAKSLLDQTMSGSMAQIIEDADSLMAARYEVFRRAAEGLPSILSEVDITPLPLPSDPNDLGIVAGTLATAGELVAGFFGSEAEDVAEREGEKKAKRDTYLQEKAKAEAGVLKVDALASHIAANSHGKMAVAQVETQLKTLMSALDGFAQGDKTQEQVAAMAYKALQEGGADTDYISDLMARTMIQATEMKKDASTLAAAAAAGEKEDKAGLKSAEGHTARALRIANMARALSQIKDKEGNLVVSDFGDGGGMYDVYVEKFEENPRGIPKMADTVREVFGALIKSDNPAVIIAALRDADLTNDPEVGQVISQMDPRLKKQIIDSAERELRKVRESAAAAGLGDDLGSYLDYQSLPDLQRQTQLDEELAGLEELGMEDEVRLKNQQDARFDEIDEEFLREVEKLKK